MSESTQPDQESPACATGDVHQRIVEEAAQVQKGKWLPCKTPAIDAVMATAADAIQRSMPSQFEHEGRTYWLTFSVVMATLEVFDNPTARLPLTAALTGNEVFGHKPGQ